MQRMIRAFAGVVALVLLVSATPASAQPDGLHHRRDRRVVIEFAEAEVFTEINATDGDAGFHLSVDGEDWRTVKLFGPDGKRIFVVRGGGSLGTHGITGLTFESAEPPFDELALEEFKTRFPEGTYRFRGKAIDGSILVGEAEFTHAFPVAPVVTSPMEDGVLDLADPVIRWEPVAPPSGSPIIQYEVIVSREDPGYSFAIDLPPDATSVTVPGEFLVPDEEYKVEVLAKEASGNQTITEVPFVTSD